MKTLIEGIGFGAEKAVRAEEDMSQILLTILSSDNSGGYIRLSKAGARALMSSLKSAIEEKG